jgi:hypothetical protein
LVTPTAVCRNPETFGLLKKFIREGGKVIFYGPAEQLELLNFLGLETDSPLAGEMKIKTKNGLFKIIHNSLYSAGSVNTVARSKENTEILAEISLNGKKRVYATISNAISNKGGQVAWIRGTNSFVIEKNGRYPAMLDRSEYFYPESLMRLILGEFGVEAEFEKTGPAQPDPVITSCYNRNGLYVSAYVPDMNTTEKFRFPEGAPVFIETETVIEKKKSVYHLPKASHLESRIFIDMEDGPVKCVEETVRVPEIKRHIRIEGLKNATVRFRPETGTMENVSFVRLPASPPFLKGDFIDFEKDKSFPGTVLTLTNVNGAVTIITRKNKRKGKIKK